MKKAINQFKQNEKLREIIFLLVLFIFSILFRRVGLKHGFPLLTNPDEFVIIEPVLNMTNNLTLNPEKFNRPDQTLYLLNFIYLNLISFIKYGVNMGQAYADHILDFYFYGRLMIAIMGALIPVVAYGIGKEVKPKLAVPAALVFAFYPQYAENSMILTSDVPITLFTLIVTYFALRYLNTENKYYLGAAVFFAAVNTAEKYPGLLSLGIVFVSVLIQMVKGKNVSFKEIIWPFLRRCLLLSLLFVIALFIIAPYLFIEFPKVVQSLKFEARDTHLGADGLNWFGNFWFYCKTFYEKVNILGILLFGFGIWAIIRAKDPRFIILLYGFGYMIALSVLGLHWARWFLPMAITPLMLIAYAIEFIWQKREKLRILQLILIAVSVLFIFEQFVNAVHIPIRKSFIDTRVVSKAYCEENGINLSNTIYEGYSPLYPTFYKIIFEEYQNLDPQMQYIILSERIYRRFFAESERYSEEIQIYTEIRNDNQLIASFAPYTPATNTLTRLEDIFYFIKYRLGLTDEIRFTGSELEIYKIAD